jgi:transketolase
MAISTDREKELQIFSNELRKTILTMLHGVQSGHPGGSLSCVEILTVLYLEKMRFDPKEPEDPERDRLLLSKGHACPTLYAILAKLGAFPEEELLTLRQLGTRLQGHPQMNAVPGIEMSSGPLGLGLSVGVGMALAARLDRRSYHTFVILGDGELQEGIIWEAAMSAAKFHLDNLIAIVDLNGVQLDGTTDEVMPLGDVIGKFETFGWNAMSVDGHDVAALSNAIDEAKKQKKQPTVIVARTIKGKGVSFMEGQAAWHGQAISSDNFQQALTQLEAVRYD